MVKGGGGEYRMRADPSVPARVNVIVPSRECHQCLALPVLRSTPSKLRSFAVV